MRRYMQEGHVWTDSDCAEFVSDRNAIRSKHRVMTAREYDIWRQTGDMVSSPSEVNAFPGGLTITFNDSDFFNIIGKVSD